jgi:WD40 repeat protein
MTEEKPFDGPRKFSGHISSITALAFSPDGRLLLSGSSDRMLWMRDVASGETVFTRAGHEQGIASVAFSPDGMLVATGSSDRTVKVWDAITGRKIHVFTGHCREVTCVTFSRDGHMLASSSKDGTVYLWDVDTCTEKGILPAKGYLHDVYSVVFSPDGRQVVASTRDNKVWIWDSTSGEQIHVIQNSDDKHWGRWGPSIAFSPDGKVLAAHLEEYEHNPANPYQSIYRGTIKAWDAQTWECLPAYPRPASSSYGMYITFTSDGRIFSTNERGKVQFWNVMNGIEYLIDNIVPPPQRSFQVVTCTTDGKAIAGGTHDGDVFLWTMARP